VAGKTQKENHERGKGRKSNMENSNQIMIRPATEQDMGAILGMIRELAEYESMSGEVTASEQLLTDTLFRKKAAMAFIAEYNGEAAGYTIFFYNISTFLGRPGIYMEDLFVKPEFRKHGIGTRILKELARWAEQNGCARLDWSCLDWNESSIRFYRGLGAEPMSGWTQYRMDDTAIQKLLHAE
jgi:GNAT superfamily N-acetyltransferase